MAIVIEEEKRRTNAMGTIEWLVFFAVIIAAIYYIFFAAPEAVVIAPPANLASTTPILQITFNSQDITNSASFQSLKQYISSSSVTSAVVGRANPFVPPQ